MVPAALCLTPRCYSPSSSSSSRSRVSSPAGHNTTQYANSVPNPNPNPKHAARVMNYVFQTPPADNKYHPLIAKAAKGNTQNTKPNSVICADCDGNGAVLCSQCKGSGVNSVDIFDGKFKAGDSCWLCGGRKEMLCGNCNGAGFVGGFLSTHDQ